MKRESHAMLAHQTKQVTFLLPKIGTQNETLDSDIKEGCMEDDNCQLFRLAIIISLVGLYLLM